MINQVCLYWHTLRYLKFSQLYLRLKFKIFYVKPNTSPEPALRAQSGNWIIPIPGIPSLIGPEDFLFLNQQGSLSKLGWDGPTREKLWRYNQHYFNDLNSKDAPERFEWHVDLLKKWVKQNPPPHGVGWDPYPTSLRIINWIKWSLAGNPLPDMCIHSLAVQARLLMKRLELHLLGNHLLANAKALIFSGLFFQGDEANCWLKKGLRILELELEEQILEDGGHFERSTMYHSIILEDLLDLINIAQYWSGQIDRKIIFRWKSLAKKMLLWLRVMTHPDGQISFFNDAALNITANIESLSSYAQSIGMEPTGSLKDATIGYYDLADTGYIRLESIDAVALLDVAPIGPNYLPGHAHADTLSFEMSIFNQRVIVNGGTSCYGIGSKRIKERGTSSHSTVEIDGKNSSQVWSGFRVARRAFPLDLKLNHDSNMVTVSCSHDGYKYLPGRPVHQRIWTLDKCTIKIEDLIHGSCSQAIARFIIHPSIGILKVAKDAYQLSLAEASPISFIIKEGVASQEIALYSPEFGKSVQTSCIAIRLLNNKSSVEIRWN